MSLLVLYGSLVKLRVHTPLESLRCPYLYSVVPTSLWHATWQPNLLEEEKSGAKTISTSCSTTIFSASLSEVVSSLFQRSNNNSGPTSVARQQTPNPFHQPQMV